MFLSPSSDSCTILVCTPLCLNKMKFQKLVLKNRNGSYVIDGEEAIIECDAVLDATQENKIKVENLANYSWDTIWLYGNLVDYQNELNLIAYPLKSTTCGVRVMHNNTKIKPLLQSSSNFIYDISFSKNITSINLLQEGTQIGYKRSSLAYVDANAQIFVYEILVPFNYDMSNGEISCKCNSLLHLVPHSSVETKYSDNKIIPPVRVKWYSQVDDQKSEYLFVTNGKMLCIFNINSLCHIENINSDGKAQTLMYGDPGNDNSNIITFFMDKGNILDCLLLKNLSILVLALSDGSLLFYENFLDGKSKLIKTWKPHSDCSITSLYDLNFGNKIYLVTMSSFNSEFKIWDYEKENCLQTLKITKAQSNDDPTLQFKCRFKGGPGVLVLSDINGKAIYILTMAINQNEPKFVSLSCKVLSQTVISFAIQEINHRPIDLNKDKGDSLSAIFETSETTPTPELNDSPSDSPTQSLTANDKKLQNIFNLRLVSLHPNNLQRLDIDYKASLAENQQFLDSTKAANDESSISRDEQYTIDLVDSDFFDFALVTKDYNSSEEITCPKREVDYTCEYIDGANLVKDSITPETLIGKEIKESRTDTKEIQQPKDDLLAFLLGRDEDKCVDNSLKTSDNKSSPFDVKDLLNVDDIPKKPDTSKTKTSAVDTKSPSLLTCQSKMNNKNPTSSGGTVFPLSLDTLFAKKDQIFSSNANKQQQLSSEGSKDTKTLGHNEEKDSKTAKIRCASESEPIEKGSGENHKEKKNEVLTRQLSGNGSTNNNGTASNKQSGQSFANNNSYYNNNNYNSPKRQYSNNSQNPSYSGASNIRNPFPPSKNYAINKPHSPSPPTHQEGVAMTQDQYKKIMDAHNRLYQKFDTAMDMLKGLSEGQIKLEKRVQTLLEEKAKVETTTSDKGIMHESHAELAKMLENILNKPTLWNGLNHRLEKTLQYVFNSHLVPEIFKSFNHLEQKFGDTLNHAHKSQHEDLVKTLDHSSQLVIKGFKSNTLSSEHLLEKKLVVAFEESLRNCMGGGSGVMSKVVGDSFKTSFQSAVMPRLEAILAEIFKQVENTFSQGMTKFCASLESAKGQTLAQKDSLALKKIESIGEQMKSLVGQLTTRSPQHGTANSKEVEELCSKLTERLNQLEVGVSPKTKTSSDHKLLIQNFSEILKIALSQVLEKCQSIIRKELQISLNIQKKAFEEALQKALKDTLLTTSGPQSPSGVGLGGANLPRDHPYHKAPYTAPMITLDDLFKLLEQGKIEEAFRGAIDYHLCPMKKDEPSFLASLCDKVDPIDLFESKSLSQNVTLGIIAKIGEELDAGDLAKLEAKCLFLEEAVMSLDDKENNLIQGKFNSTLSKISQSLKNCTKNPQISPTFQRNIRKLHLMVDHLLI